MKFTILLKNQSDGPNAVSEGKAWRETYERHEVTTLDQAKAWAADTIGMFNQTRIPGERKREIIEVIEDSARKSEAPTPHKWEKKNLKSA